MTPAIRPILALPDHLINQIAAGEVVERPVSVVKELIENSLDAGATRISVELEGGGIDAIVVQDNGTGINSTELGVALTRHCTSKISQPRDLDAIVSLGFRGEALASIGAVADLVLTTRTASDRHAWRLQVAAGSAPQAPVPAQGERGTRVEVRRLFHNVPARKRFLKQARTEYLHVLRLLRHIGFACPRVHISLTHAGGRGLRLAAADYAADGPRWRALFGAAFAAQAVPLARELDGLLLRGWVAPAALATNLADTQFLALNGRTIRDKPLQHAIRLAYGDTIAPGRFPAYALALELAPEEVDVNVHPGKLEVRFADVRGVHDLVCQSVKHALAEAPTATATATTPEQLGDDRAPYNARPALLPTTPSGSLPTRTPSLTHDFGQPLAQIDGLLIYRLGDGHALVDLNACWRAVLEKRLYQASTSEVATRPLLIPQRLPLPAPARRADLAALGFVIDDLGSAGSVLRAVPTVLPELDAATLVAALELELAGPDPTVAACAVAAARACVSSRMSATALAALTRAATACDFDLGAFAISLSGPRLRRLLDADHG